MHALKAMICISLSDLSLFEVLNPIYIFVLIHSVFENKEKRIHKLTSIILFFIKQLYVNLFKK